MILAPDDFAGRPYGWLTNQCGHFVLGLFATTLAPPVVVLGLYAVWEIYQHSRGGTLADSLTDWLFVALGALWAAGGAGVPLIALTGSLLAYGAYRRKS